MQWISLVWVRGGTVEVKMVLYHHREIADFGGRAVGVRIGMPLFSDSGGIPLLTPARGVVLHDVTFSPPTTTHHSPNRSTSFFSGPRLRGPKSKRPSCKKRTPSNNGCSLQFLIPSVVAAFLEIVDKTREPGFIYRTQENGRSNHDGRG